jgi:predicted nuclease of predicted toxin-antitoxin system
MKLLSPRWVSLLNGAGIEAAHWSTIRATNAPDRRSWPTRWPATSSF